MPFLARFSRGNDRYQWAPIRDSSQFRDSSHASAFFTRPRARLSRPPDLPFRFSTSAPPPRDDSMMMPLSPPPSYDQVRNLDGRERAGLVSSDNSIGLTIRPVPPTSPAVDMGVGAAPIPAPLTSTNLARLDSVRYGDVSRNTHLKNRISTVSQYPVLLSPGAAGGPSVEGRRPSRRRPASIASTSTTGIYLAVGQLPGSEPFDLGPPSKDVLDRHDGRAAQPLPNSPTNMDEHNHAVVQTAQAVRVLARNTPSASTTSVNHIHRVSIISTPESELSPRRRVSVSTLASTSPRHSTRRPSIQPSHTWPVRSSSAANRHVRHLRSPPAGNEDEEHDDERPPPPPPKDPGYVKRTPRAHLRGYSSTPYLHSLLGPSAMEREGIIKEHSGVGSGGDLPKPTSSRNWLASLGVSRSQQSRNRAPIAQDISSGNLPSERLTSNRRSSQLLVACARLIGRAMPKVAGHHKGS